MNTREASYWIQHLQMEKHPEGGYFKETYRAAGSIAQSQLPDAFGGARSFSTAIYFLLTGDTFSAFHRIASDELWHFYDGDPLTVYYFDAPTGELHTLELGLEVEKGQLPQVVVPAGVWFASRCQNPEGFTLTGCTVAPGFDFTDFELAREEALVKKYPAHRKLIQELTRD